MINGIQKMNLDLYMEAYLAKLDHEQPLEETLDSYFGSFTADYSIIGNTLKIVNSGGNLLFTAPRK